MGRVYLARSEGGRTVAVKVVQAELAQNPEFRGRFASEVAAARRVGGTWTAPVLDADTDAATPWVATGYVPGPDLHSVVTKEHGPLPAYSVRALANGLAHALQAIHGAALVHRDLKPSNVLLTIDGPRVIDFGIARALDTVADGVRTHTGAVIGSPGFMSPEQVRGQRLTPASDVFCLGSVLAYAATGKMPFGTADSGVHALMFRIAEAEPDLGGVPAEVVDLVRVCLTKDPTQRPTPEHLLAWTADADIEDGHPWLPGALLAQLGRRAARLLDADAPPHTPAHPLTVRIAPPQAQGVAQAPGRAAGSGPDSGPGPGTGTGSGSGLDSGSGFDSGPDGSGPGRKRGRGAGGRGPARRRPRARFAWLAAATAIVVTAATVVVVDQLSDRGSSGQQQPGADARPAGEDGSGSGSRPGEDFDGAWEGLVERTDSSITDEHEYLRIDVDGDAAPGEKAADVLYLGKYTYCKIESTVRSKGRNSLRLGSAKVVKAVPASAAKGACDLAGSSSLASSGGRTSWSSGEMTADLRPVTADRNRPVPAAFLGTWRSELQGTLTIRQGPVGTKVGTYTGWSVDWRCNESAELVSVTEDTITLSPNELDASTPRGIGCPDGVPVTLTRKSKDRLDLRYPESTPVRLTRTG
jgi:hypothetical protein